jgi:hypothetical protein
VDRIDIDAGSMDQIGAKEEVVGSDGIGVEKDGDLDALSNGGADGIGVVDKGGTDRNNVDDADVDLDSDEEELQIGGVLG